MKEKTCCFTGHRDIPSGAYQRIFKKTEEMVESLIQKGYLYFGAGGALGFDTTSSMSSNSSSVNARAIANSCSALSCSDERLVERRYGNI